MLGHFEFAITSEKRINKKEQKKQTKKQVVLKINSWHILQLIRLIGKKRASQEGRICKTQHLKIVKKFLKNIPQSKTLFITCQASKYSENLEKSILSDCQQARFLHENQHSSLSHA